jgi:alkylation response protein AidB-like acyl-CoA dehydrogenase
LIPDPEFSTEPGQFREQVRAWLVEHSPPTPDFQLPQNPLEITSEEQFVYLRDWQGRLHAAGLVGLEWPVEYGGRGMPAGLQRIANQEMTRAAVPFLVNIVGLSWAGPIIRRFGTEEQKLRYLPKLLSAEEVWCQGFSEPGAGSDLASLRATARRDNDEYVIDGHKVWTSQAQFAAHCILLARTDPNEAKHAGISYFLAPMDVPGVDVQPLVKMTGEGGFNQVIFTAARIPADTLLGREGQGWELATATLSFERGASEGSAGSGGGADHSVSAVIEMARGLSRDGRPVLDDPIVRDRLAAFAIEEMANRLSNKRARVKGLVSDRPMSLPLTSKLTGSELGQRLSDYACELQGWSGSLYVGDEHAVEGAEWQRAYMNSYAMTIAGGTSEVVRNVVGEKVLGLPKTR